MTHMYQWIDDLQAGVTCDSFLYNTNITEDNWLFNCRSDRELGDYPPVHVVVLICDVEPARSTSSRSVRPEGIHIAWTI